MDVLETNLKQIFMDLEFPAQKMQLIEHAKKAQVDSDILNMLQALPPEYFKDTQHILEHLI